MVPESLRQGVVVHLIGGVSGWRRQIADPQGRECRPLLVVPGWRGRQYPYAKKGTGDD